MRLDEEKYLKCKICDDFLYIFPNGEATVIDIISALENHQLRLEILEEDGSSIIDEDSLEEIKKCIPNLMRITEKPRSFIKSFEDKVPVETAKRINYKAITKVGRDSNDWYARTFLNVKPKNIVADVNEETIDLYENRFILTLIDRIYKLVIKRRQKYEKLLDDVDVEKALSYINNEVRHEYHNFASLRLFRKISKAIHANSGLSFVEKLKSEYESTVAVEKKIKVLTRSDFYNSLKKKKRVGKHILKTNIIMFEYNYNKAFKLWEYLNKINNSEVLTLDEIDQEKLPLYYNLYCSLNVIASLYDMGFIETTNNKLIFDDSSLYLSGLMKFERKNDIITFDIEGNNKLSFRYCVDIRKDKWDEFNIYPNYQDFENLSRVRVDSITTDILNELVVKDSKKNRDIESQYAFISLDINSCSDNNDFGERLYRRFYNIGDNFSQDEMNENIKKWANYKTGMLIVSPIDLRFNFLHIQRIINYHILKRKVSGNLSSECPICSSKRIRIDGKDDYVCYDCNHRISINYCSNCDSDRKKPMLWIKYMNDKFLQNSEVIGNLNNKPYHFKLRKYESVMGEYAISSFELVEDNYKWKLKSICPQCGVKLGDVENK